ncbi:MAG: zinc ribbon domain-containing protein [Thiohalocapsa sp.]|nr:zinc ribbon domain-containing protein [Thiohalocapsa sp.]MCF7991035.1 zinc ribbon domain-containing protein [Thiohalocapsa sp.]
MNCPKCGADQPDGGAICSACGVVYEKYWKYHPRPGQEGHNVSVAAAADDASAGAVAAAPSAPWRELILPSDIRADPVAAWARGVLLIVITVWGLGLIGASVESNAAGKSVLHLVNLPFHEAGHVLFSPFGDFIGSLGGTLGQLLMPLICLGVLLIKTRDPFGASVALWWLGQNFLDIAPYINDARAGQLPLIGGNFGHSSPYGFHDWEYLLTETGLLRMDHTLAQASHLLGSAIMLLAIGWGATLVYRQLTADNHRRTPHRHR